LLDNRASGLYILTFFLLSSIYTYYDNTIVLEKESD